MGTLNKESTDNHKCIMSRCSVEYQPDNMIYSVTMQCKFCGKIKSIDMDSSCVHDFLAAVTMGS